ncbi:Cupin domain protein [Ekhidna lutea]|uniref:Cupin domain protein n=1 Tax=Ekhidna lutea TaxID=447679 RepID=A0A239LBF7_EKHLU|nr:cupin domain-containing protein [Ekhidna lutea]SNT27976.1 Cupin domain protein [Ekhidna lutea]
MKKINFIVIALVALAMSCTQSNEGTHSHGGESHTHDQTKETFSIEKLVAEVKTVPDSIMEYLHAQHHSHKVLERRTVPPGYESKELKNWSEYVAKVEDLPAINPGPGEYVHVMEGYKHGYKNLVIGITETFPGGAPPMHTHKGEESHVLLEGTILYALGDTLFTIEAPYIVNIPPMVPHAFKNIGEKTANLVVIFPTNMWEYDVLDFFPFKEEE